jgi:hypothetical protein
MSTCRRVVPCNVITHRTCRHASATRSPVRALGNHQLPLPRMRARLLCAHLMRAPLCAPAPAAPLLAYACIQVPPERHARFDMLSDRDELQEELRSGTPMLKERAPSMRPRDRGACASGADASSAGASGAGVSSDGALRSAQVGGADSDRPESGRSTPSRLSA